jgi:hypothetical protein
MTLARFQELAAAFGARLLLWPEAERSGARALLEGSAEARLILQRAAELDELMRQAHAADAATHWPGGLQEQRAALSELRAGVSSRISQLPQPSARRRRLDALPMWLVEHFWTRGVGLATSSAVAAVLGLLIGWIQTAVPAQPDVLTLLEASPFRLLIH